MTETWNRRAGAKTEICIRCGNWSPAAQRRRCKKCLAELEQSRRARLLDQGDGRPCAYKDCEAARYRLVSQYSSYCYEHHRLARKKVRLKASYGLSLEEYDALMAAANGRCLLCGSDQRLVVDHCHNTGTVRGILCDDHNVMLGLARDNPDVLLAAATYIMSFRNPIPEAIAR